jgi:hypothetical protein
MGYTHYWTLEKPITQEFFDSVRDRIKAIVETGREGGIPLETDFGISHVAINGVGSGAHETFSVNVEDNDFNFCKTAEKPYDAVVTAILILLKKELGDSVKISSDGSWRNWEGGRLLFETVFDEQPESVISKF